MQVRKGNIRLDASLGGGRLGDLGVYCINAARYLFDDEPIEVLAFQGQGDDPRFKDVEEAVSAVLRFPGERLASFTCSFGAADAAHYQILGSTGDLRVDPAYEYEGVLRHQLTLKGGSPRKRSFKRRDQFAPELIYFAECIRKDEEPEPSGAEGLQDVRIMEGIYDSIESGKRVKLAAKSTDASPSPDDEMRRPPPRKKPLIQVRSAHR